MRTPDTSLASLLFGNTRARILAILYGTPHEAFFVRQIARSADTSVGTVQRELSALAAAGLISRAQTGSLVFYRANREHPAFPELYALLAKIAGVFHQLAEALAPSAKAIQVALVYGSFARGAENAHSDVDLLVVGEVTLDQILDSVIPLERTLGRPVNPTVYSVEEIRSRLNAGNHFLRAILMGEKTFLIGSEHEFRELLEERLAPTGSDQSTGDLGPVGPHRPVYEGRGR